MKKILYLIGCLSCALACFLLTSCSCQHDHKWDEGKIIKSSTETEYGKVEFHCKKCDETKYELIAKLPHEHKYSSPLESDRASHWYRCDTENCTVLKDKEYHLWDGGVVITEANQQTTGTKKFTCTVCKYEKTDSYRAATDVTEAQWKSAMETSAFENFTLLYQEGVTLEGAESKTVECTKDKIKYTENGSVTYADNREGASLGTDEIVSTVSVYKDMFEAFEFDDNTKSYFYRDGEKRVAFQFSDGKISYFCITTDTKVTAYSFSKLGSTVFQ